VLARPADIPVAHRGATRRRAWPDAAVLAGYALLALLITRSWWNPLGRTMSGVNGTDATLFSWLLTATPHALADGAHPLFSDRLNFPTGINLMWNNGMVLPGAVFAPVTALFGGLATVTVLTALGLAGTAATAYGCLRSVGTLRLPAALGGGLFGFSPAMTAQALGHPNLVFNVLLPVILLLSVRLMIEHDPPRRTAVLLGLTAGAQVLIGEETLFLAGIVVALILLVLVVENPGRARERARRFVARAALALGVFLAVAGFPLGYQLFGPLDQRGSPFDTAYYSTDLAGLVLPTELQLLVTDAAARRSARFAGGLEEHTAYLGWPLLLAVLAALVLGWPQARIRVPLLVGLGTTVFGLGPELIVLGAHTGVPLPWALLRELPGFEHVIVTRFALCTGWLFGAGLAFALDDLLRRPPPVRTAGLVATALVVLPLLPAPLPGAPAPQVPAFFTSGRAGAELACPGGSALVLPFPRAGSTDPMHWQQAAGMSFAMPGGYFIGPGPDGRAYVHGAPTPTGLLFTGVHRDGVPRPVTAQLRRDFAADLRAWRACTVVLGPSRNQDALRAQATALIGREPEVVDGVYLWRDLTPGT
jgi:hypothetical protein